MGLSLRFKIIFITVVVLIFAIGATAIASGYVFVQSYSDLLQSRTVIIGQGINSQLNRLLELGIPLEDLTGFEKQLQDTLNTYDDITYAMVVDLNGTVFFHNDPSQQNTTITDAATLAAVQSGEEIIQDYSDENGEFQDVFIPIVDRSGEHVGAIRLGFPTELITERITQLAIVTGAIALVSLVVATILLIITLTVWVTNPLTKLLTAIRQISGGEQSLATRVEITSNDELGELGAAFNTMAAQLNESIDTLEQKVAERTQGVETVAALSEKLVAILNLEQLLQELVDQVHDAFNYYYIDAYLVDDQRQNLVISAGIGQAGTEMKKMHHTLSISEPKSLIARAARTGQIFRLDNALETEGWLPNPLLPDTVSEMAVPIILEGTVVGVLDIQENKIAGLDEGDANLLRLLASQVAVAIRNARLFNEVETALAEAHDAQERYVGQTWKKSEVSQQGGTQLFTLANTPPPDELKQQSFTQLQEQVLKQGSQLVVAAGEDKRQAIATSINLSGKTIGTIQIHNPKDGQIWTDDDKVILEAVVEQFAQTAENLRLFDQTRQRASREATIREITDKLRAAPSLERLIDVATEELGQRLGASHAKLELGIEEDLPPAGNGKNTMPKMDSDKKVM